MNQKLHSPRSYGLCLSVLTLVLTSLIGTTVHAQRLATWTSGPGELGLGFPVPIPVDTPDAFDGFRTYDGLHFKHQDLMTQSDNLTGMIVGQTRDNRDIWAYVFSDPDDIDATHGSEYAIMMVGSTHAREWQSPEVTTGIMEYLIEHENDGFWIEYMRENGKFVILPVLNIDGFLQTQRYPTTSYLDSGQANDSPRDGRLRRKNMLNVDEIMDTTGDHLLGVDLNRNNLPHFGSGVFNTADMTSLLYRGVAAASEPEIQAMQAATGLGPVDRLRFFADVHSFGANVYVPANNNIRRTNITRSLHTDFMEFNGSQPGNRTYPEAMPLGPIGAIDEYFANVVNIPAITLEVEPSLFGSLDYAGLGSNFNDGFLLPESEISRVRENMAKSFAMLHYNMAGAPAISTLRWYDKETSAIVFNAEWDVTGELEKILHVNQLQPLQLDREYVEYISFNKPMRWRSGGQAQGFPGLDFNEPLEVFTRADAGNVLRTVSSSEWLDQSGFSITGFQRYRDDSHRRDVTFLSSDNADIIDQATDVTMQIKVRDMVGTINDANPATIVDWADGHWTGLEDDNGEQRDVGGSDRTIQFQMTSETLADPFLIGPGQTAAWFDPDNAGEGFIIEILDDGRALVYWFTYDENGNQRWFIGIGEVRPNELYFPELLVTSGGIFGDDFDPASVVRTRAGSAHFIFSDCNTAQMRHDITGVNLRQSVIRLTNVTNLGCEDNLSVESGMEKTLTVPVTGSWFDVTHDGEGFVIEQLSNERVLVYWFTYDDEGNQAWVFGDGTASNDRVTINDALLFTGGRFGADFNPNDVTSTPWGTMEFDFECDSGSMSYDSVLPEFGSGSQNLTRLSSVAGIEC